MSFKHDVEQFLGWYLSPFGRMKRGPFMWIFFFAFVPVLVLQVIMFSNTANKTAQKVAPVLDIMGEVEEVVKGKSGQVDPGWDGVVKNREAVNSLQHRILDGAQEGFYPQPVSQKSHSIPWAKILNVAIYFLLLPIVQMRLRDMGKKNGVELWIWTALIYATVVVDALKLFGISAGSFMGMPLFFISFFILGWMCSAKSKERKPVSERIDFNNPQDPLAQKLDDDF